MEWISRTGQGFHEGWCWSTALRSKQKEKGGFKGNGSQTKTLGQKSAWGTVRTAPDGGN